MSSKDRNKTRTFLVHTKKDGYTSIDYGRNEGKRRKKEAVAGMTRQQLLEAKLAAQREDRRLVAQKREAERANKV